MNGIIYIELPFTKCSITDALQRTMGDEILKSIAPYFANRQRVEFFDRPREGRVVVSIMDVTKRPNMDQVVRNQIGEVFSRWIYDFQMPIEIRLNYAKMNPAFQPVIDTMRSPQPKQSEGTPCAKPATMEEGKRSAKKSSTDEFNYEKLSYNYAAEEPRFTFNQVILPQRVIDQIEHATGVIQVEHKVFDEWGLRSIIPNASSALNFYGPPGTGKSMAAEAIAAKLGKKILSATYADIESKFHGEGPKMVKAIFMAAERDDAVLFLDESDSLLSKRLSSVSEASAQAINSMRSQLLISLERFKGIVIFATNLVVNYDRAFLSRLINIEFTMPTEVEREKIWWQHLRSETVHVPLADDVDIASLAKTYEFCGREIKSAVKSACIATALEQRDQVTQSDFIKACEFTKEETRKVTMADDHTESKAEHLDAKQKDTLKKIMQKKLDASKR